MGCLPITYVDDSVSVDFNPVAMINLKTFLQQEGGGLAEIMHSQARLAHFADQCLLLERPSTEAFRLFMKNTLRAVSS